MTTPSGHILTDHYLLASGNPITELIQFVVNNDKNNPSNSYGSILRYTVSNGCTTQDARFYLKRRIDAMVTESVMIDSRSKYEINDLRKKWRHFTEVRDEVTDEPVYRRTNWAEVRGV